MYSQDYTLTGDVDCSGEVNSDDASLILQYVTNVINELPCQDNITGLTLEQLQEIINMVDEQLSINYSGGDSPIMISSISSSNMNFGDALIYCNDLDENGYTDWFLPNLDQLAYAVGGGCELPDERTSNRLWTTSKSQFEEGGIIQLHESGSNGLVSEDGGYITQCRCVRFGLQGTSNNSNNSSSNMSFMETLEQPINMIGPMYLQSQFPEFEHSLLEVETSYVENSNLYYWENRLYFFDAIRFCRELEYDDYSDWYLPTFNQLIEYIQNVEDITIPNNDEVIPLFTNPQGYFDNTGVLIFHTIQLATMTPELWYYPQVSNGILSAAGGMKYHCFCVR